MSKISGIKNPGGPNVRPTFSMGGVVEQVPAFNNGGRRLILGVRKQEFRLYSAILADCRGRSFVLAMGFEDRVQTNSAEPEPEPGHCQDCQELSHTLLRH